MKNIIFLCPLDNTPSGGIKVIHNHCQIINDIGCKSEIFYINKKSEKIDWFNHSAPIKKDNFFNSKTDFVIIPENNIFGYWKFFQKNKIPYAIFVQNAYLIWNNISLDDIKECYRHSELILSISNDTTSYLSKIFPEISNKIHRVSYSINLNLFHTSSQKEKIITFMPRKMSHHSKQIHNIFKVNNITSWKILPLENMNEAQIAENLSRSSIFLAFSDFEGLPVPPVEAAVSGNFVIGYHGQGGQEYWHLPLFKKIEPGNIIEFYSCIIDTIKKIDNDGHTMIRFKILNLSFRPKTKKVTY